MGFANFDAFENSGDDGQDNSFGVFADFGAAEP